MSKKKRKPVALSKKKTLFHEDLEGFDLKINTFGEMESTFSIDKLNTFLDIQIENKKLKPSPNQEE